MQMIKKILFVNPKSKNTPLLMSPPLVLGMLAEYVKKGVPGIEVKIVDEIGGERFSGKIIKEFAPDLIAVTCMTEFSYRAYQIAEEARSHGIKSIVGGKHPSIFPEEAKQHFDYVVVGDGEVALSRVVRGEVSENIIQGEYLDNLDDIPPTKWDLFQFEKYFTIHLKTEFLRKQYPYNRVAHIHTDRGCPNSCVYCYNSTSKLKKLRYHSASRVIYELKYLADNHAIDHVHFIDDNLLMNRKRLTEICRLILNENLGITWDCASSSNAILANTDLLPLLKEAGCRAIAIGLESQSGRILKLIKGPAFSPENNIRAVKICKDNGLIVQGNFLIGIPGETEEDLNQTINYIMAKEIDLFSIQVVKPYPGTRLWDICLEKQLIPDDFRWDEFFNYSFHEKFSYSFLSKIVVDCNNAYIPYTPKRLFKEAMLRPKDAIRKIFSEKDVITIVKKAFNKK